LTHPVGMSQLIGLLLFYYSLLMTSSAGDLTSKQNYSALHNTQTHSNAKQTKGTQQSI